MSCSVMLDVQFPYIRFEFEFESDALTRQSIYNLDLVRFLSSSRRGIRVEMEGHTSSVGDAHYNVEWSRNGAQQVLDVE